MKFSAILISLFLVVPAAVLARADGHKGRSQKVEQSVPADPNVRVSLCVASGDVNVRGWDKNEVLARSDDGVQIELRRNDATSKSNQATKLEVLLMDRAEGQSSRNSCLSSSDVTLNVPRGATVQVQTRDGDRMRLHAWCLFAGLNQSSRPNGPLLWQNWKTSTQAFINQYNPWKGTDGAPRPTRPLS